MLTIIQHKWNLFITCSNFIYISRFITTQLDPHYDLSSFTLYLICISYLFNLAHLGIINSANFTIYFVKRYLCTLCKLYKLFNLGLFTDSKYLHLVLALIQLMWTHFLYLSILTLVSTSFLQSNVDIFVQSMTSIGTNLALWLCKLLKVPQNNRLFSDYLCELYCLLPDTYTLFVPLHMHDTLYSYSSNQSFHF